MGSKEQLAELVSNLPEWQAGHLLGVTQAYLAAVREAEEKGRKDVSGEVINFLSANTELRTEASRAAAAPQAAGAPKAAQPVGVPVWQAASYDRTAQGPNMNQSAGRVIYSNPSAGNLAEAEGHLPEGRGDKEGK